MDGILIGTALLIAIMLLRQRGQDSDTMVFAPVRVDSDDSSTFGAIGGSSFMTHESPFLSSDDDWPTSSAMDDSPISIGYEPDTSTDTSRWTDPTYAYEPDNIYHGTVIDPTYHNDDWSSSTSSFDDSWSDSGFSDSCSSSSFDD